MPRHEKAGKVQRAEVAGFIGQQGLFAAGVGAFDLALRRSGVVAVDAVKEDDAGIAALPRLVHQQVEHFAGVEAPLLLAAGGVDGLDALQPDAGLFLVQLASLKIGFPGSCSPCAI